MKRWTTQEDEKLTALAASGVTAKQASATMPGRTAAGLAKRAAKIGVSFQGGDPALRAFLDKGGVLVRDEIGGAVGVRWGCAHRSGGGFDAGVCEKLREFGFLRQHPGGTDNQFSAPR